MKNQRGHHIEDKQLEAKQDNIWICPACGAECDFFLMPGHMEEMSDDKHRALFRDLDLKRNDAYMDTECQWVVEYCKEKKP